MRRIKSRLNGLFLTSEGSRVVAQKPNLPITLAIIFFLLSYLSNETWGDWARGLGYSALVVWAGMEVWSGVNLFRRLLGAAVLLGAVVRVVLLLK